MVTDLLPGPPGSAPSGLHGAHGSLYFVARAPGVGYEPWVTDGTSTGTRLIGDLYAGSGFVGIRDMSATANGTLLALQSQEGDFSGSLWVTTSTGAGEGVTTPLVDWGPWFATNTTRVGDDALVWFSDFQETSELWRTDGTADGTRLVRGGMQSYAARLVRAGDVVFFADIQSQLWVSDGTTEGTQRLHTWGDNGQNGSVLVMQLATAGARAFFNVQSPLATGDEMWVSDGTVEGTQVLKDINPGPASARPAWLTRMGSQMFFVANDGKHGRELWRSDGTAAGTTRLSDQPMPQLRDVTRCRDRLYFITLNEASAALWSTDGTAGHVERVADLPGHAGSWRDRTKGLTCMPGGLLFTANDGVHGREPWTWAEGSDTALLHDLLPGAESSHPAHLTRAGDKTYLRATDGVHGHELWVVIS
jgi:ELWxxDGT repeat protein